MSCATVVYDSMRSLIRTTTRIPGYFLACLLLSTTSILSCNADETRKSAPTSSALGHTERNALKSMVEVPAGSFMMGCDDALDKQCDATEQPAHRVSISAFRIDRTEVTAGAYARCVQSGACTGIPGRTDKSSHQLPVTGVTWEQASRYCVWKSKRLPSEDEWEFAARGSDGRIFPWGNKAPTCERAHTADCGSGPVEVGGRQSGASPFGALDMAGNVDEWTASTYHAYGSAPKTSGSRQRVACGGAYDAWHSRSTARNALDPTYRDALLGFRCAM